VTTPASPILMRAILAGFDRWKHIALENFQNIFEGIPRTTD
jgi:hypothetical protein